MAAGFLAGILAALGSGVVLRRRKTAAGRAPVPREAVVDVLDYHTSLRSAAAKRITTPPAGRGGGRLPLPAVASRAPESSQTSVAMTLFVDRLGKLSADEWLAIGRRLMMRQDAKDHSAPRWDAVDTALSRFRLHLTAWRVRDEIETLVFHATRHAHRLASADREALAAAHAAAEYAALALLVRPQLSPSDVEALYELFERMVPLAKQPTGRERDRRTEGPTTTVQ